MVTDNKYYVYLHIKSSDGTPFYVGKGKGDRCSYIHRRGSFWDNVVNKHGFEVLMLEDNLNETLAFDLECYWIDRIGRRDLGTGPLINLTGGGEGTSGRIVSDKERKRIGNMNRGKTFSKETREKISEAMKKRLAKDPLIGPKNGMYGRVHPKEWRENHSNMISSENNPKSKLVLDVQTGVFYYCIREVADAFDINYSTLKSGLNNKKIQFNRFKKV